MRSSFVSVLIAGALVGCGSEATIGLQAVTSGGVLDLSGADAANADTGHDVAPVQCSGDDSCEGKLPVLSCRLVRCGSQGVCEYVVAPDGDACQPTAVCVEGGKCQGGACLGGVARDCDDANPCTTDRCEPSLGCVHDAIDCPDGDEPCRTGTCSPETGACTVGALQDGTPCDDGIDCSVDTVCEGGACVGGQVAPACDDGEPCTNDVCTAQGCANIALDGVDCDDGDACTVGDRCDQGVCSGAPKTCDDVDACTLDACVDGACVAEPIEGCVVATPGCDGKAVGQACDDGDAATFADLCSLGVCRGFAVTRVASADVAAAEQLLSDVTRTNDGRWLAVRLTHGAVEGSAIVSIEDSGAVAPFGDTVQSAAFTGLHEGFAIDDAGVLWERDNVTWSTNTPLPRALADSGVGSGRALWGFADDDGQRLWIVGINSNANGPWLRRCTTVGLAASTEGAECVAQNLVPNSNSFARTIVGTLKCANGLCRVDLVAGADLFDSTGADGAPRWFNDVYKNDGQPWNQWVVDHFDPGISTMTTWDAASLGDSDYVVVGGAGYLRATGPTGSWKSVNAFGDQDSVEFRGAWSGADIVVIVGWQPSDAGRRSILWAAPRDADPSDAEVWHRFELGTELGDSVGLFDVTGADDGRLMVVGGSRTVPGAPSTNLVLIRIP